MTEGQRHTTGMDEGDGSQEPLGPIVLIALFFGAMKPYYD